MRCKRIRGEPFRDVFAFAGLVLLVLAISGCTNLPTEAPVLSPDPAPTATGDKPVLSSQASAMNGNQCVEGTQRSGALYQICMPADWNGDLVVYAHGYVAPHTPLKIPDDEVDGTPISQIINDLGYAFASTSYRANGLVVPEGVEDLVELVEIFGSMHDEPVNTYLVGASEGGLITALAVEQFPGLFDGGLPGCGPIGDFGKQLDYFGDFRVLFDYFFPAVLPSSPVEIPREVMDNWDTVYEPRIKDAIRSDPGSTQQLLRVTLAPTDPNDADTIEETVLGLLWYNVFATNNAVDVLAGQPFDNADRIYFGSDDDLRLNQGVQRFRADGSTLVKIEGEYQTSGRLRSPVVTLHTTGDPIVPIWHEAFYQRKVSSTGSRSMHTNIPIVRYGHCNFTVTEVLAAFAVLVFQVTGEQPILSEGLLPNARSRAEFTSLARVYGL